MYKKCTSCSYVPARARRYMYMYPSAECIEICHTRGTFNRWRLHVWPRRSRIPCVQAVSNTRGCANVRGCEDLHVWVRCGSQGRRRRGGGMYAPLWKLGVGWQVGLFFRTFPCPLLGRGNVLISLLAHILWLKTHFFFRKKFFGSLRSTTLINQCFLKFANLKLYNNFSYIINKPLKVGERVFFIISQFNTAKKSDVGSGRYIYLPGRIDFEKKPHTHKDVNVLLYYLPDTRVPPIHVVCILQMLSRHFLLLFSFRFQFL